MNRSTDYIYLLIVVVYCFKYMYIFIFRTWRKDIAIPIFEQNSIEYYNPQVGNYITHIYICIQMCAFIRDNMSIYMLVTSMYMYVYR